MFRVNSTWKNAYAKPARGEESLNVIVTFENVSDHIKKAPKWLRGLHPINFQLETGF